MIIICKHDLENIDFQRELILFKAYYNDSRHNKLTLSAWSHDAVEVECVVISPSIENSDLHSFLTLQGITKTIAHSDCSTGVLATYDIYCSDMEDPL